MPLQWFYEQRYRLMATVVLIVIGVAYQPGLSGPFVFDDMPNIVDNPAFQLDQWAWSSLLEASFSMQSGPLYRPVSMFTLALNQAWFGFDPLAYKVVNLGIHLLTTCAVAFLIVQLLKGLALRGYVWLTQRRILYIGWLAAAIWGLHPFNLTSVLYVVQRMTSLSGLFMLLALGGYCLGRNRMLSARQGWPFLALSALCFFLAVFSKENSLVWPLLVLLVECYVYRFSALGKVDRYIIRAACVAVVVAAIAALVWLLLNPGFLLGGFQYRDFTMEQRLMTQLRVLWWYLYWILVPDITAYGLYHDDILLSTGLLSPVTTLLSLVAWCLVIPLCLLWKRLYWLGFGLFFFLICHLIESSAVALELVHEHRNYVASLGVLVPLAAALVWLWGKVPKAGVLLIAVLLAVLFGTTLLRSWHWSSTPRLVWHHVQHHPLSARANYEAGAWYFSAIKAGTNEHEAYGIQAEQYFARVTELDTQGVAGIIGQLWLRDLKEGSQWADDTQLGAMLVERLSRYPVGLAKASPLISWLDCHIERNCEVEQTLLAEVTAAVLGNEQAPPGVKGRVSHLYGLHLYHEKNAEALDYILLAIGHDRREGEYWMSLIATLLDMGALGEARLAYQDVRELLAADSRFAARVQLYDRMFDEIDAHE